MSNINDMGLPQGLPWVSDWYDARNTYTHDYVWPSRAQVSESCAREMTAADLGLSGWWVLQEWTHRANRLSAALKRLQPSEAPYAFWLGADG
jgi:hypothetical protein